MEKLRKTDPKASEEPQRRQPNIEHPSSANFIRLVWKAESSKKVRPRGNRTPIYRENTRRQTQPFQIPHKLALKAVRVFSRTKIHTKRFLSRSVSPHEASLHMKRLPPQRVFPHEDVSSHEAFRHTMLTLTSSPFNTGRRAPTFLTLSPSPYFTQTGSSLQISLTSSPFNTGRRAPTIYEDEPFTVLQIYGLLPTNQLDELSLQHRPTSSYCL